VLTILQPLGTAFAFLLGLAFGSFLNVVLTRLPEGESIIHPGSHCRNCDHTLAWWENLPLLSWIGLRGRCRQCHARISFRYPLTEFAVGLLWAACWINFGKPLFTTLDQPPLTLVTLRLLAYAALTWLLVALATLDAEHLWLPDWLTYPGILLGLAFTAATSLLSGMHHHAWLSNLLSDEWTRTLEALLCAGLVLFIRLAYWLVRRREGMGLGDAKLMGLLGVWLGLEGGLESFAFAALAATAAALAWLVILAARSRAREWTQLPLPLGTFLCLAALLEIFYPGWLFTLWSRTFLP
jgi:leader peptidase (prepilin peptidase)/N-methyltransferase